MPGADLERMFTLVREVGQVELKFTVADAYLFTVLRWSPRVGIDLSKSPNVTAYVDRVAARPKVQEALKAEGLLQ